MGDAFEDRLEKSLGELKNADKERLADKVDVKPDHRFVGFDAYQKVLGSGVDVVLLTTPPHFRPLHLKAAVEAGKHVFAEKPVAVDAPGVRSVAGHLRGREEEKPVDRLRPVLALRLWFPRDGPPHPRRRARRRRGLAGQRLSGPELGQAAPARLDRHAVPDAQLVQLHLALRRFQRRAARALTWTCAPG